MALPRVLWLGLVAPALRLAPWLALIGSRLGKPATLEAAAVIIPASNGERPGVRLRKAAP